MNQNRRVKCFDSLSMPASDNIQMPKRDQCRDIIGVFILQKLILVDGFLQLTILKVNGGQPLSGKLQIIFELQAVLVKLHSLRFFAEPFITIPESLESHRII